MPNSLDIVDRIFTFNEDVVGVDTPEVTGLGGFNREWLRTALEEEAKEFYEAETIADQVDALVDSMIFAIGGLRRMGLTRGQAKACIQAVLDANDQKAAGRKASRDFGVPDAIKPEGWVGPEARIKEILE